jgi:hypothetical protein
MAAKSSALTNSGRFVNRGSPLTFGGAAMRFLQLLLLTILAGVPIGCGGDGGPGSPPAYDPDALAKAAITQLDKNGNGTIEGSELDACPSLKSALAAIDKNKDKALAQDELAERFKAYKATKLATTTFSCGVKFNGQPLEGATVTFVPEEFLKGTITGGSGKSDATGNVAIVQEGTGNPGLPYGLYRITVSKKNASGAEILPAKYVNGTALGREISPDPRGGTSLDLLLTSP